MRDAQMRDALMKSVCAGAAVVMLMAGSLWGYPLDGYPYTGIARLEGLRLVQTGKIPGPKRVAGARLGLDEVDIRLTGFKGLKIPEPDEKLSRQIRDLLGEDQDRYGVALLDVSDPGAPRYAGVNPLMKANPGSVGKILVALAVFQALFDRYPDDIEARLQTLRNTLVTADDFILSDHHKVPMWKGGDHPMEYRPLHRGDTASLWTYLDWMMSASSNAAAAMVQKELLLMRRFGGRYPVSSEVSDPFFSQAPKTELKDLLARALQDPVLQNGLDLESFRQGSFFTWNGKKKVPGATSYASPEALVAFLLRLEQGRLVDEFSSREIKRLLYMTGKRIRYASSPALYSAAVYFKSGSLYKCRPEPEFTCRKYRGNVLNQLCSVAIVEDRAKHLHYMVAVMSNVLYKNSAVAHQTLATRLHRLIEARHQ